ncbi:protein adenylyltransferase SelO [Aquibacillus rhizosphaerae]|uniref:Protein nucleotidyltransferase YdiU n=1 Tax=Aquibacillus rhizosphaerae TaxID=3051431 RepID=A0ABT7L5D0_9BACI|nr:YdiU family protein [Aquibacillus sp. LR5S19]MDL4839800.1 YdiU family protein [Aquibacillus sp. LR5S19]
MTKSNGTLEPGWNLDNSYTRLPETFFSSQNPNPVSAPKLIVFNHQLATSLGLNEKELQSDVGVDIFAGNKIPPGASPIAQAYAGHQFGHFTMLGDGRAILLGEQITPEKQRVDIQLKGSGRTPYSRGGDGRASIGPMLREHIMSEAMHALGIPTTRSLAVVTTGEQVIRETDLPGAILTRVAASHLRVGTFEYAAKWGEEEDVKALVDYTINRHYPEIEANQDRYLSLLQEVIKRQAELIAKWQLVGFIHGVMNTDNMTISGETIDYGPCAFMDEYDPATVFSSIDRQGRYAYGNQPPIGGWNLARFAETLLPLLDENQDKAVEIAQDEIKNYMELYHAHWLAGMRAKLGIFNEEKEDEILVKNLLNMMHTNQSDYTNTFRALTLEKYEGLDLFGTSEFKKWEEKWLARIDKQKESKRESQELMKSVNPAIIPRNHRVEEALEAAVEGGDYRVMEKLLHALSKPFAYSSEQDDYAKLPQPSNRPYQTFCGT